MRRHEIARMVEVSSSLLAAPGAAKVVVVVISFFPEFLLGSGRFAGGVLASRRGGDLAGFTGIAMQSRHGRLPERQAPGRCCRRLRKTCTRIRKS